MRHALFLSAAAFALAAASAADATDFSALAIPGINNGIGGCLPGTRQSEGSNPVQASITCGDAVGAGGAAAMSSFGHIGASASASTISGSSVPGQFVSRAFLRDTVVFTSTDPTATTTSIAVNLILDGVLNAAGVHNVSGADASLGGHVAILGVAAFFFNYRFFSDGTFMADNPLTVTGSTTAPNFNAGFTTPFMSVALNSPVTFELELDAAAEAAGENGSATSDFGGSFKFPTGTDAFTLASGVTANSGDWLVNNRFIDSLATPTGGVPEPTSWALMIAGFGLAGAALRRRRALAA